MINQMPAPSPWAALLGPLTLIDVAIVRRAVIVCAGVVLAVAAPLSVHAQPTVNVWVQTQDSCKRALGGATYQLTGNGFSQTQTDGSVGTRTVSSGSCPLQHGSCSASLVGCVEFVGVPAGGTYTVRELRTPPGNTSNPEGYAPCNAGSACRDEQGSVAVDGAGAVTASTTNVDPDAFVVHYPSTGSVPASLGDPLLFHDFGLAPPGYNGNPQCDGDSDADDHSTGSPSSHCQYKPESDEALACQPFPWSCQTIAVPIRRP